MNLEEKMILLGENTDGLIASELLKPSREQITVFCGVPRKEMATLFRNGTGARFPGFQQVDLSQNLLQKKL